MDLILRLRVGRAAHQLFFVDVTVFMTEQSEKREARKSSTTTEQETTPKSRSQTVQTTRLGCQTDRSKLHTPPATINSPIEQKLQFSVCKTMRRFAGPSLLSCVLKPSFTKICIRISICKTSLSMCFECGQGVAVTLTGSYARSTQNTQLSGKKGLFHYFIRRLPFVPRKTFFKEESHPPPPTQKILS